MTIIDQELHELDALVLPDGKLAKTARWGEVRTALEPVLGDDFDPAAGKGELLRRYHAKLAAERAANPLVAAEDAFAERRDARRRKESHDPRQPLRSPGMISPPDVRPSGTDYALTARPPE